MFSDQRSDTMKDVMSSSFKLHELKGGGNLWTLKDNSNTAALINACKMALPLRLQPDQLKSNFTEKSEKKGHHHLRAPREAEFGPLYEAVRALLMGVGILPALACISMHFVLTGSNPNPWHKDVGTGYDCYLEGGVRLLLNLSAYARIFSIGEPKGDGTYEWKIDTMVDLVGMDGPAAGCGGDGGTEHARGGGRGGESERMGVSLSIDVRERLGSTGKSVRSTLPTRGPELDFLNRAEAPKKYGVLTSNGVGTTVLTKLQRRACVENAMTKMDSAIYHFKESLGWHQDGNILEQISSTGEESIADSQLHLFVQLAIETAGDFLVKEHSIEADQAGEWASKLVSRILTEDTVLSDFHCWPTTMDPPSKSPGPLITSRIGPTTYARCARTTKYQTSSPSAAPKPIVVSVRNLSELAARPFRK